MASTTLPNGIIVPEKFSRDWYADLYHNWQELDNLLGGGTPKDGTLTIQKNGDTVGTFSANQATNETINIEVPDVNNGTLTIQQNGITVDTFTANSSSDKTVNIQCVDLENNQTVAGNKEFTGTTTAHDLVPSATETYNLGSSSYQWNNAYIKSLTINGVACGDILTHNASEFVNVSTAQTIGGEKTFIGRLTYKATNTIAGDSTSGNFAGSFNFIDKNNVQLGMLGLGIYNNNGYTEQALNIINPLWFNDSTKIKSIGVRLRVLHETEETAFTPSRNNLINLGSSTQKWKLFNGVNPGALSLPGTSVNVDTTNWVLDGSDVNIFTPASDGWLGIQVTDTVYDQMHYVFVGRNDSASYYQQNVLSPINALWDSKYHGCVFIPVIKNVRYDIRCICSTIVATFYPCQGNV